MKDYHTYIDSMTLREKAAYLLCPGMRPIGTDKALDNEKYEVIFRDPTIKTGSIFVFGGKQELIQRTVNKANEGRAVPVLVAADTESGAGTVNHDASRFPTPMGLSAAGDTEALYEVGQATAEEALPAGINWSFGPVIDLNLNPLNPVTNIRSLGDNPDEVAQRADRFIRGIQSRCTAAAPKHFPGDGVDNRDQHLCTSVNSLSREAWMATYGKVWKAAIAAGAKTVMVGHIALPAFEEEEGLVPASLSHSLITGLLRETLGFEGLVVTDALNMGGCVSCVSVDDVIIKTIQAGSDVLLFVNFLTPMEHAVEVIEKAVKDGRLTEKRLDLSIARILALKEDLGLLRPDYQPFTPLAPEKQEHYHALAARLFEQSITLYKDVRRELPLDINKLRRVISFDVTNRRDAVTGAFDNLLREQGIDVVKYDEFDHFPPPKADTVSGFDAVFVNLHFLTVWGTNWIRPASVILQYLYEYFYKLSIPVILITYGSPYAVRDFPCASPVICAYNSFPETAKPVFDIIFGNRTATGRCPVNLEESALDQVTETYPGR